MKKEILCKITTFTVTLITLAFFSTIIKLSTVHVLKEKRRELK